MILELIMGMDNQLNGMISLNKQVNLNFNKTIFN